MRMKAMEAARMKQEDGKTQAEAAGQKQGEKEKKEENQYLIIQDWTVDNLGPTDE